MVDATAGVERGGGAACCALHVEDVVAAAEVDDEILDAVIVDAALPRRHRRATDHVGDRNVGVGTAEGDGEGRSMELDRNVVGERERRVRVVRVEDRAQRRKEVGGRSARGDRAGCVVLQLPLRVREDEVDQVRARAVRCDRLHHVQRRRRRAVGDEANPDRRGRVERRDQRALRRRGCAGELAQVEADVGAADRDKEGPGRRSGGDGDRRDAVDLPQGRLDIGGCRVRRNRRVPVARRAQQRAGRCQEPVAHPLQLREVQTRSRAGEQDAVAVPAGGARGEVDVDTGDAEQRVQRGLQAALAGRGADGDAAVARREQLVGAGCGGDVDGLLLSDRGHPEAGQRRAGQGGGRRVRVLRVVDDQVVDVGARVDRQQAGDACDQAGVRDVDRVAARAGVDARVAGDRLDVDRVVAGARDDRVRRRARALDRECVVAVAEVDVDRLELLVGDATGHRDAADDRVATHAEPGDRVLGQRAVDVVRVVRVVEVERVDLLRLVDRRVGVERRDEIRVTLARDDRVTRRIDIPAGREGDLAAGDERLVGRLDTGREGGRDGADRAAARRRRRVAVVGQLPILRRDAGGQEPVRGERPVDAALRCDRGAERRIRGAADDADGVVTRAAARRDDLEVRGERRAPRVLEEQARIAEQAGGERRREVLVTVFEHLAQKCGGEQRRDRVVGGDGDLVDGAVERKPPLVAELRCAGKLDERLRPRDAREHRLVGRAVEDSLAARQLRAVVGQVD